jgi:hypothetical protein
MVFRSRRGLPQPGDEADEGIEMMKCQFHGRPRRIGLFAGASAALLLGGCTTHLTSLPDRSSPSYGIPYRLPMQQFEVTVTWTISKCLPGRDGHNGSVEFEEAATFTAALVEGEPRVLDYRQLTNHFKTGDLKVEYHPGTLIVKSINSTIEGHEPEAVSAGLKLGFGVARLAMGLPASASGGGTQAMGRPPTPCIEATEEMVEELAKGSARMKQIPVDAKVIADRMAVLRARAIGNRLLKKDREELEGKDGKKGLQEKGDDLAAELSALTETMARLRTSLSYSQTWKFPEVPTDTQATLQANPEKVRKWLTDLLKVTAANQVDQKGYAVEASLVRLVADPACPSPGCGEAGVEGGYVFRQPVEATLRVSAPGRPKPLISEKVSVPQLGRLTVLPLRSRWGEKNSLVASFDAAGVPTSIEYKALNAPGVKALELGNEAIGGLLGLRSEIRAAAAAEDAETAADLTAARQAELDTIKHQINVLTEQGKLAQLQEGTSPELDALQAQLAILRLQKEQSDLNAAIRKNDTP